MDRWRTSHDHRVGGVQASQGGAGRATASHGESKISVKAAEIVGELAEMPVKYMVTCMLCGASFEHRTTIAEAAEYEVPPRGICGRHGPTIVEETSS